MFGDGEYGGGLRLGDDGLGGLMSDPPPPLSAAASATTGQTQAADFKDQALASPSSAKVSKMYLISHILQGGYGST